MTSAHMPLAEIRIAKVKVLASTNTPSFPAPWKIYMDLLF